MGEMAFKAVNSILLFFAKIRNEIEDKTPINVFMNGDSGLIYVKNDQHNFVLRIKPVVLNFIKA